MKTGDSVPSEQCDSKEEMSAVTASSMEQTAVSVAGSVISGGRTTPVTLGQEASDNLLFKMISFQGWLSKFQILEVRHAFLNGKFKIHDNTTEMLQTIDFLIDILLPYPHLSEGNYPLSLLGIEFFNKLMRQTNGEPCDANGDPLPVRKSYQEWALYLGELSVCRYWTDLKRLNQLNRTSVKVTTQTDVSKDATQSFSWLADMNPPNDTGAIPKTHQTIDINRDRRDSYKTHSAFTPIKEEQKNYASRFESRYSDFDQRSMPSMQLPSDNNMEQILRSIRKPKEVVAPRVFSGSDGTSLKEHLTEFEAYFDLKYEGSERQKSQILGDFLEGAPRRAYDALDGQRCSYTFLKSELIHWYSSFRASERTRSESEFRRSKMCPGDSLTVFAMRLERIAAKAYPNSTAERHRQLLRKLWKSVPETFQRILADGERNIALSGGPSKLDWPSAMRLAEIEDRQRRHRKEQLSTDDNDSEFETRKESAVWYSKSDNKPPTKNDKRQNKRVTFDRVITNSKFDRSPSRSDSVSSGDDSVGYRDNKRSSQRTSRNQTTGKQNHRASRQSQTSSSPERKYERPTNQQRHQLQCHWCGRYGHSEERCWEKLGACMRCGDKSHKREECPQDRTSWRGFTPVCPTCGGHHLGRDCVDLNGSPSSSRSGTWRNRTTAPPTSP